MSSRVSTLGLLMSNINTMASSQKLMSTLSKQLASEKKSYNLSDYASSTAQTLMTYNSLLTQQNSYTNVMSTISTRISAYDAAMSSIEDVAATASSTLATSQTYNTGSNNSLAQEIQSLVTQISGYLNTKVGDRYIFSGSRYDTVPVKYIDLSDTTAWPSPPTDTVVSSPDLPLYDTESPTTNADAYTRDTVSISATTDLNYGVTSTEDGFQEMILGLRWAYAATQSPANYETYMTTAMNLISQGTIDLRTTHTRLSNANATLEATQDAMESSISTLKGQVTDLQAVDTNEISLKITTYQSTLESSYSAIAIMTRLSIVNYL